jgi:hypothetical protein
MSRPHPILANLIALAAALALFTGCGGTSTPTSTGTGAGTATSTGSPSPSQPESASKLCDAARAYAAALTSFKDTLKPDVPIEQVRTARDQVVKAYDDLVTASADVAKERVDAVIAAENKFTAAVQAVPDQATLPQAIDSLRDEAANVQAALSDLAAEIKC